MKGPSVDKLVYDHIFPHQRTSDPQCFQSFLQRHLILEVRSEVHSFYGHLDTQEAKYPGLDYCNRIHRIRLGRWPWHRRLFRAFDDLRLTPYEISALTKWEGTKWAKERYEKEQGIKIRDTAADDMVHWGHLRDRPTPGSAPKASGYRCPSAAATTSAGRDRDEELLDDEELPDDDDDVEYIDDGAEEEDEGEDEGEDEESDEEMESVGVALNERLRLQAARREAGDATAVMDEEWEQWLKNALETGEMPSPDGAANHRHQNHHHRRSGHTHAAVPPTLVPSRMLSAARAGHWHEIPDALHGMVRCILRMDREDARAPPTPSTPARPMSPSHGIRRHFTPVPATTSYRRPY